MHGVRSSSSSPSSPADITPGTTFSPNDDFSPNILPS
jgi:hypothetical protein